MYSMANVCIAPDIVVCSDDERGLSEGGNVCEACGAVSDNEAVEGRYSALGRSCWDKL